MIAKLMRVLSQEGSKVIEVGANFGQITLQIANHVGPTGFVWTFEPFMC